MKTKESYWVAMFVTVESPNASNCIANVSTLPKFVTLLAIVSNAVILKIMRKSEEMLSKPS